MRSRQESRSRAHPSKAGMSHFEQQIKQADLERTTRTSRASKYRDTATDPKTRDEIVGAKQRDMATDPIAELNKKASKKEIGSEKKKDSIEYHDHLIDIEQKVLESIGRKSSRLSQRRKSNVDAPKNKGSKLVYLPYILKNGEEVGDKSSFYLTKGRGSRQGSHIRLASTVVESKADDLLKTTKKSSAVEEKPKAKKEKHAKDKANCAICIRKRAEREQRRKDREALAAMAQAQSQAKLQTIPSQAHHLQAQ